MSNNKKNEKESSFAKATAEKEKKDTETKGEKDSDGKKTNYEPKHPKHRRKRHFNIFKKKKNSESADSIATLYKQTEELFPEDAEVEKDTPDEEKILAHIMNKKKKRRKRTIILASLLALIIIASAAIAGFLIFNKRKQFAENQIKIEIVGPEKAHVGDEVTYIINYRNDGQINIKDISLFVRYPHGFQLSEKVPDTENSTWKIDKLKINESGQIKLTGKLIDTKDEEQKIQITFAYTPENFSSEFSQIEKFSTELLPIEISTEVTAPEKAVPGQKINILLSYENATDTDYENLIIKLATPSNFEILQTNPGTENQEWIIEKVEANSEKQEIKVEGKFADDLDIEEVDRDQEFALQILFPGEDDEKLVQSENMFTISLSDQEILSYLIVNGKTENSHSAYGEAIRASAVFKNSGDNDIENATLKIVIDQEPLKVLDWKDSEWEGGVFRNTETGHEIVWENKSINAGEEKSIDIYVPVKKLSALQDFSYDSLSEQKTSMYCKIITEADQQSIDSSVIEIDFNTDLSIGIKALYYDNEGNEIGSGPLPPQTGEQTTYKIFWDISNHLHELTDIKIKAQLPDKVSYSGNENLSTGRMKYNSDTNEIIWEINKLPQGINEAHVNFELTLKPNSSNIGKLMKLTETTTIEAKDSETKGNITISLNPISTTLESDEHGSGQGVVVESN